MQSPSNTVSQAPIDRCLEALKKARENFARIADAHKRVLFAEEAEFARSILLRSVPVRGDRSAFKLCFCDPDSVYHAILQVAKIGVTLNPTEGLAYLVPRKNQQRGGILECHLEISYKGMIQLAIECGTITHVVSEQVFQEDLDSGAFQYLGPAAEPIVKTNPFSSSKSNTSSVGVWCTAFLKSGGVMTTYMRRDELDTVKLMSFNKDGWNKFSSEYEKKTCIRRAFKLWPKPRNDDRLAAAIAYMNETESPQFSEQPPAPQPHTIASTQNQGGMAAMIAAGTQGRSHVNQHR